MKKKKKWNPRNLTILLMVLLLAGTGINIFSALSPTAAAGKKTFRTVIVQEGDNLWDLAAKQTPHQDTREVIEEIVRVNNLSDTTIVPGQVLEIPSEY